MSPVRALNRNAQSADERTNRETIAPPTSGKKTRTIIITVFFSRPVLLNRPALVQPAITSAVILPLVKTVALAAKYAMSTKEDTYAHVLLDSRGTSVKSQHGDRVKTS